MSEAVAIEAETLANRLIVVTDPASCGLPSSSSPLPGYLVLNPIGLSRRAAVVLPEAALDLRPEGALRAPSSPTKASTASSICRPSDSRGCRAA